MKFSIVICTHQRPRSICQLLYTLSNQTMKADEILIIDGSTNVSTENAITPFLDILPIRYIRVESEQRGLTRQRNIGILMVSTKSDIVIFLDDDVIPESSFCSQLISVFDNPEVIGADGYIVNECRWKPIAVDKKPKSPCMVIDGFYQPLSYRERIRLILGLFPIKLQPGIIPLYGHGKSALPPTGKSYEVEHIMGGITAYRKIIFSHIQFSTFFDGYGLYEDYDFSIRASKYGKLITNTAARLVHHHEQSGRPNTYRYGKMVVTNGWYVWRLRHPNPGFVNIIKWHMITILLAIFRLGNAITLNGEIRKKALFDFTGRIVAWSKLIFIKPSIKSLNGLIKL
jgi:GT2 family glycosyltransferase